MSALLKAKFIKNVEVQNYLREEYRVVGMVVATVMRKGSLWAYRVMIQGAGRDVPLPRLLNRCPSSSFVSP